MLKKISLIIISVFLISVSANAQFFNQFSISGGPIIGWHIPNVTDLNLEMQKAGIPEFSKSGFLTLGGGGSIDIPVIKGLRVGAFGTGFTEYKVQSTSTISGVIKSAKLSYSYGAISIEYVRKLSEKFEFTAGCNIGIGKLKLILNQFSTQVQNWNMGNDTLMSKNYSSSYSTRSYSVNPQVGIGFYPTNFMCLKLNAGYMFTIRENWKLNDVLVVSDVPTGIKADGFNFNLGINVGLFVK